MGRGTGPSVLWGHATARLLRGLLRLLRLRLRLSWRTCQTILVVGTGGTVPGVAADVASGVRRAAVPAMAARAMSKGIRASGSKQGYDHQQRYRPSSLQFRPARRSASSTFTAASWGVHPPLEDHAARARHGDQVAVSTLVHSHCRISVPCRRWSWMNASRSARRFTICLGQSFGSLGSELRNDIVDTIRADEPAPIRRAVSRHA